MIQRIPTSLSDTIDSSPHLGPLRSNRAAQSFSLRSRRQRKAWGVSPRNESRRIFRARAAGDSGNATVRVVYFTVLPIRMGFRCSIPGFMLSPAPQASRVFSTDFMDTICKRSCQSSLGSFHLGYGSLMTFQTVELHPSGQNLQGI